MNLEYIFKRLVRRHLPYFIIQFMSPLKKGSCRLGGGTYMEKLLQKPVDCGNVAQSRA